MLLTYWLVSGYGLRASRALVALVVTVAVLSLGLQLWGFPSAKSYGQSVLYAAQTSVSLLHPPDTPVTSVGEILQIALRLTGPLLFGLALLALRNRVKR